MRNTRNYFLAVLCALALSACGDGSSSHNVSAGGGNVSGSGSTATLSLAAQAGQQIFYDANLSGNKNMSCATCHSPQFAYGPPNSLAVQIGSDGVSQGGRAVPSLRYKSMTPPYSDNAVNPDGVPQNAPGGGFMWDGRAPTTLAAQAGLPLLNPVEMNNASPAAVVQAVQKSSYAPLFQRAFGANVFDDPGTAFTDIGLALQAYQQEDPSFAPYSSKFDLYRLNKAGGTLTAAEMRGLEIFNNANPATAGAGGCAACHVAGANFNGSVALMTDFTYSAIGAPRNDSQIPNNPAPIAHNDTDPAYFDMGLCGPDNTIHLPDTATSGAGPDRYTGVNVPDPYCGNFKVPTLRNVATRGAFFHNGVFHSLTQVLQFYNTRDTHPEYWYPGTGGDSSKLVSNPSYALFPTVASGATIQKFNDLPVQYQGNIDEELPLGQGQSAAGGTTVADGALPRAPGSASALTDQNIADLACFLNTLTDGYQPPATPPVSGACVN